MASKNPTQPQIDILILRKAPDIHHLLNLLADINDKWYTIGLGLNVPRSVLNGLQADTQDNIVKLDQVLQTWIDRTDQYLVTWETVLTAIEGPIINNKKKANQIHQFLLETYQVPAKVESEDRQQMTKEMVESLTKQLKEKDEEIDHLNECLKGEDGNIQFDFDGHACYLHSPTNEQWGEVVSTLQKKEQVGKEWTITLFGSSPKITFIIFENLNKLAVVKKLRILNTPLDLESTSMLSKILIEKKTIKELYLYSSPLICGIRFVTNALAINCSLEMLQLSGATITDGDSTHLFYMLSINKTLKELHLRSCHITDTTMPYICKAVAKNGTLKWFDISDNPDITSVSTTAIVELINTTVSLNVLNLTNASLKDNDIDQIFNALASNNSITELWLQIENPKKLESYDAVSERVVNFEKL